MNRLLNFMGVGFSLYSIASIYQFMSKDPIIKKTIRCQYCCKFVNINVSLPFSVLLHPYFTIHYLPSPYIPSLLFPYISHLPLAPISALYIFSPYPLFSPQPPFSSPSPFPPLYPLPITYPTTKHN